MQAYAPKNLRFVKVEDPIDKIAAQIEPPPEGVQPLHLRRQRFRFLVRPGHPWPLSTLVKVQAERYRSDDPDHHSVHTRYSISSATASAEEFLAMTRSHWSVENSLHWVLDMALREDESRLRKEHNSHNFTLLRHLALSLLKQEPSLKVGIRR